MGIIVIVAIIILVGNDIAVYIQIAKSGSSRTTIQIYSLITAADITVPQYEIS